MNKMIICCLIFLISMVSIQARVIGSEVAYKSGNTVLKGYIAWDDSITGKRPGVIMVHEWGTQ